MKANGAPERIYVHIKYKPCEITFSEVIEKECSNIEYIRKDAFIEKAREWLNKESESYVKTGGVGACVTYEGLDVKELVEDFEKYMEGE